MAASPKNIVEAVLSCCDECNVNHRVEHPHAVFLDPQAAAASFKSIVEAVLSWQTLHNEALAADILQILNLHKVPKGLGFAEAPPEHSSQSLHPHAHCMFSWPTTQFALQTVRRCCDALRCSGHLFAHLQEGCCSVGLGC